MLNKLIKIITSLVIAFSLLIIAFAIYRSANFTGSVKSPVPVPENSIIDLHVHVAGYGNGGSGCYVSDELKNNFRFDQFLAGFGVTRKELEQHGDQYAVDKMASKLKASQHVDAAVLLALDGAVDEQGELDLSQTEIYVPNDYVATQVARFPELFYFGASINPYRKDALARLEQVHQQGAVLIKWIPNIQYIDPADPVLKPFYEKMKALDMVLLSHTGQERSFSKAQDEYGDPKRLELPLSIGVKVVAAHIATTGQNANEDNYERILPMLKKWPNLYADISSLTQINKLGYLNKALQDPRLDGRLIYGSDFPLINMVLVSSWYFPMNLTMAEMKQINAIKNYWDRDIALKQALGVPADVFTRSAQILEK